ncbi:hypothetical protein [Amycolatopsis pigmentata]|uniref:K+-transporting ATPase, KdpF subunit n=1 Tax=Amycolatopsis pigmentata TaxID=450801 RepID=A0ABW5FSU8_9PSEU
MLLAGLAMLVLSLGYLLLVIVTGKFRDQDEPDLAGPEPAEAALTEEG